MDLIITHSDFMGENGYFFQATCGKREAYVSFCASGHLTVCCRNAAHKVFKGPGKTFLSLDEAIGGYKSSEMRSIILAGVRKALEELDESVFKPCFLETLRSDLENFIPSESA